MQGQQQFGLGQQGLGLGQQSFGLGQQGFGMGQQSFGLGQQGLGLGQQPLGLGQQPFGLGQQQFGLGQQQPLGLGQSSMSAWGGLSGMGAFAPQQQQLGVASSFPQQSTLTGAACVSICFSSKQESIDFFFISLTSGPTQQIGTSVAVPAATDSRSASTSTCFNIIDSDFPLMADLCSVLPQTTFSLPNFFGHQSKAEVDRSLNQFVPAVVSRCFKEIRLFTCPLFFPSCDGAPILPCARLCRGKYIPFCRWNFSQLLCFDRCKKSLFCF